MRVNENAKPIYEISVVQKLYQNFDYRKLTFSRLQWDVIWDQTQLRNTTERLPQMFEIQVHPNKLLHPLRCCHAHKNVFLCHLHTDDE